MTAAISGFSVFVNSFGVRAWKETADATTYTTSKNFVAGSCSRRTRRRPRPPGEHPDRFHLPDRTSTRLWLVVIAIIGGAVPFILFFEGLASATSTQAAFIHKSLIIWVALMAPVLLRERLRPVHAGAIMLLVAGQLLMAGGISDLAIGRGELMILAATLLWSVEVILSKRLLAEVTSSTLSVARMVGGVALLISWGLITGGLGDLAGASARHWAWIVLTGVMLAGYVATWHAALSRAPAVDVTAVLVGGALITAALRTGFASTPLPDLLGLVAVGVGAVGVYASGRRTAIT